MKRIKIWLTIAALAVLLTGCADELESPIKLEPETYSTEDNTNDSANTETNNASDTDTTNNNEDDMFPPEEGMVRSRLTNEWVDANVANTRPIAVMTPNEAAALPHYGLSQASVLYEANVEGSMTRLMAIYENWEGLEKIGNIRSLRLYYGYWATEWDAFIVHFGGPYFIDNFIAQKDVENINGTLTDGVAFFRTNDRKAPHNAYTSGDLLKKYIEKTGYSLSYRGLADEEHYKFAPKSNPNTLTQYNDAKDASYIDMSSCYPQTRCYFEYNTEDGLYYRSQHLSGASDGPHIDQTNGQQLSFKNILVQYAKYENLGEGYLAFQCHDTTRDGWYFTNGKGIHVHWKKSSDFGATRYYDDNGEEIILNTGKTMVCIVKEGDSFTYR